MRLTPTLYYCQQCRLFENFAHPQEKRVCMRESRFSHDINHAYEKQEEDSKGVEEENVCISEDVMHRSEAIYQSIV